MRIISGNTDFDLPVGFDAEYFRYNVLLSNTGEMTAPVTLPGTPNNLKLVGYSDRIDNLYKPLTDLTVLVSDGIFNRFCNMGIHTANEEDGISCTLYFATGDFYSKMGETRLNWLAWPTLKSVNYDYETTEERIQYLIDALKSQYGNPQHACIFDVRPVATTREFTYIASKIVSIGNYADSNVTGNFVLNNFEKYQHNLNWLASTPNELGKRILYLDKFEGEYIQRMVFDSTTLNMPKGYGMTPFLKLRYVLDFLFGKWGYTLDMSEVLAVTSAYTDNILVLNNVADALMSGVIDFKQLVPDVSCKEFIVEVEKLLAGKFIINEFTQVAKFNMYKNRLTEDADLDISAYASKKAKPGSSEFTAIKLQDKSVSTTSTSTTEEKTSTIDFDLAGHVILTDYYNTIKPDLSTLSMRTLLDVVAIDDIVHRNISISVDDKTVVDIGSAWSTIKLISISPNLDGAGITTGDISMVLLFLSSKVLYRDISLRTFDRLQLLYSDYISFRQYSNVPIELETSIPEPVLESMNIHTPKILQGQKVMIELIKHNLSKKNKQTINFRTLRVFENR